MLVELGLITLDDIKKNRSGTHKASLNYARIDTRGESNAPGRNRLRVHLQRILANRILHQLHHQLQIREEKPT